MIRSIAFIFMFSMLLSCSENGSAPKKDDRFGKVYDNGWVGSGGDLYKDQINPWFVKNTTKVNYCIKVDQQGFSQSANASATVKAGIEYWQNDFAEFNKGIKDVPGFYQVATQNFVEIQCDGSEDLRFLLGAGALDEQQRAFLGDVRRHIGLTVRTSYDSIMLKGKGFIFIGSDQGEESFQNTKQNQPFWATPHRLQAILIHELGHVFGLPHFGSGIMNEVFPERIVSNFGGYNILSQLATGNYCLFSQPKTDEADYLDEETLGWWGLPFTPNENPIEELKQWKLKITVETNPEARSRIYRIYAQPGLSNTNTEPQLLGQVESVFSDSSFSFPADVTSTIVTVFHLPEQQKVFSSEERISVATVKKSIEKLPERWRKYIEKILSSSEGMPDMPFLYGPAFSQMGLSATLQMASGEQRQVYVQSSPNGIKIFAFSQDRMRLVFGNLSGANGI